MLVVFVLLVGYFSASAMGKPEAASVVPPTPQCDATIPTFVGTRTLSLEQTDGSTRVVRVRIPAKLDSHEPARLVVAFHGLGGSAKSVLELMKLDELTQTSPAVLVAPQGRNSEFGKAGWALSETGFDQDADFIDQVLAKVDELVCVDRNRVFAMGYSNGSVFAQKYACREESAIVAVAGVAGSVVAERCPGGPVPMIYFHGAADPVVPFDGGDTQIGPLSGVQESLRAWASLNGCEADQTVSHFGSQVFRWTWDNCPSGAALRAYVTTGGGHHWPGGYYEKVKTVHGIMDSRLNATRLSWRFFERAAQANERNAAES